MVVDKQGFVVASFSFPAADRLCGHALSTQLHARHIVRRIDDEKERESDEIHTNENRQSIQQAAEKIGKHKVWGCV